MRLLVFPLAFMANTFAMMLVMIGLSLFGKPVLAADFGLIHGATVALFYSFSGNARSLILAESGTIGAAGILRLRLLLLLPLSVLAFMLCIGVVDGGWLFVLLLVVRRAAEWLAEVFLSEQELHHQGRAALRFLLIQGCLGLALLLALLDGGVLAIPMTLLWGLSPLLGCVSLGLLGRALCNPMPLLPSIRLLLPHFGSTAVIGVSVYVFRLFILLVAGKQVAGDLFSAFALGGILGAVFSQALGPTMVRHEQRSAGPGRLMRLFNLMLVVVLLAGLGLVALVWGLPQVLDWTHKGQLFWLAVGCSLAGGVVMVLAQRIRLRIIQDDVGGDVFGSDILANILLVASIPFVFYGLGVNALALLYLLGALLSWMFYASERHGLLAQRYTGWFSQRRLLLLIALAIFLPLFFQLQEGIFRDPAHEFSSGGVLALLPIPLSVLACYLGMVLLGGYSQARLALLSLFFVFIGMLLTSLLLGPAGEGQHKLILLIQYILPMFALVLGQQFGGREDAQALVARAALLVLLAIVPLQLLATLLAGTPILSPSLRLFSIYQHLQYVPLLFVAAYVLALFGLWGRAGLDGWLQGVTLAMGAYVVLSWSLLAGLLLALGLLLFLLQQGVRDARRLVLPLLAFAGALLALWYVRALLQGEGSAPLPASADLTLRVLEGRGGYLERWTFYIDGITGSWTSALLGHARSPQRELYPSALNYYLDFAYNFGLLGLLPLVLLALYSLVAVLRRWRTFWAATPALGLALVVIFMLTLDSAFKVGLRQPYSGVIMFFLWGLLLAQIARPTARPEAFNEKGV
ncbi:hypothetical protein SAMN05216214_110106 [Atopomonas hussainii]|uniref:Uncharacterized protein n=1 Tax=Atopomonas hussainii TaxID=1429083 RepID=A0A1H7P4Y6_9GAMM|nr:hypothetical protein [Atopomonas hussainii]SEL30177.1 hypothetical protein SAMN05216214_110106 [Atopomonas hussainii]